MRSAIQNLEESKIREVANAGMGRSDVLAFWFGESDEVTPGFIRDAAIGSLQSGETFYSHNLGLPELRDAIATYMSERLHCVALKPVKGAWTLDMAALLGTITPATKLLIVNAPNNPTGWRLGWAWHPATPSALKPRAGCAGASPPKTRSAWCKA